MNMINLKESRQGMIIISPGPLAPPFLILPSLKMTALSYSVTVWKSKRIDVSRELGLRRNLL